MERPIRYLRENFFYGRTFINDADLNDQATHWLEAQASEVPQQRRRGRPRQAQATDPRPVRGFKTLKTAYATIKGFEVMRALHKGQAAMFAIQGGIVGEAQIVERAFGIGPCALTEVMALLQDHLAGAES